MSGSSRSSLFVAASGIIEASGTVKSLTQGILDTFGLMVLGMTKLCNSFSKYVLNRLYLNLEWNFTGDIFSKKNSLL